MNIIKSLAKGTLNYIREFTLLHPVLVCFGIYIIVSAKDRESKKKLNRVHNECGNFMQVKFNFKTRSEAYAVIEKLNEVIYEYGYATESDLYDLSGIENSNKDACSEKFGWKEEVDPQVKLDNNGEYYFEMPNPTYIKEGGK